MRDRSAFGYVEPTGSGVDFAQCKTCRVWLKDADRCYWLQVNDEVLEGDTCIYYIQGPPIEDEFHSTVNLLTKKEVGLTRGDVRCENCMSFDKDDSACELFRKLNRAFPKLFNLEATVKAKACCNAFDNDKVKLLY